MGIRQDDQANGNQANFDRIHADHCCICFGDLTHEVGATCGHVFCGKPN
jgi:hypothetical protein